MFWKYVPPLMKSTPKDWHVVVQLSWAKAYPHRDRASKLAESLENMAATCNDWKVRTAIEGI